MEALKENNLDIYVTALKRNMNGRLGVYKYKLITVDFLNGGNFHPIYIVEDEEEELFYVVDSFTRKIKFSSLSYNKCMDWLETTGRDLINLEIQASFVGYRLDIMEWLAIAQDGIRRGEKYVL